MGGMDAGMHKLQQQADALRAFAEHTSDHRVWRSCRDLADLLDALVRCGTSGTEIPALALDALCL